MSARGSKLRVGRFRIRQCLYRCPQNITSLSRREAPKETDAELEWEDIEPSEISPLGEAYEDELTVAMEANDQNSNVKIN